jgi:two-component system cell cycle sensor histidine kinase/response regulator CckA
MAESLRLAGHDVSTSFGPSEALKSINEGVGLDLLITDFAMPEMNGVELIRLARDRRPGLKCLMISGYGEEACEGDVPAELLSKPFTPESLFTPSLKRWCFAV